MAAQLIITEPSGRKRVVSLAKGAGVSIARGTGNDVMLVDKLVSRRHCTVKWVDGGICVEDHNSQNGTFLNSQRVSGRRWMRDGDTLRVGDSTVTLVTLWKGEGVTSGRSIPSWAGKALLFVLFLGAGFAAALHSDYILSLLYGAGAPAVTDNAAKQTQQQQQQQQPQQQQPSPAVAAAEAGLLVNSNPPGAMVFVNNEYMGVTPVDIVCTEGLYSVRMELSGYENFSRAVEVKGESQNLDATLVPVEASYIRIESDPPDAEALVDGNKVGLTPITVQTAPGSHEVIIQKTNYTAWKDTIEVAPGQTLVVSEKMEQRNVASYLELLEEDPNNVSYYCQLGHYYILEKRYDEAKASLRKGMETYCKGLDTSNYAPRMKWLLDKIYFGDYFEVGDRRTHKDMCEWILQLYAEMINTYPAQKSALTQWLQQILKRAGRENEMERIVAAGGGGKPPEQPGPNLDIYFQAAEIYIGKERYERAVNILMKATNLSPNSYQAHYKLGKAYYEWQTKGNGEVKDKAIASLTQALGLCKDEKLKLEIMEIINKAREI